MGAHDFFGRQVYGDPNPIPRSEQEARRLPDDAGEVEGAEAIEWASRCPDSDNEIIEVRQAQDISDVQKVAAGFAEMQGTV